MPTPQDLLDELHDFTRADRPRSAEDLARLHDAAAERARELRAEAMRDFWRHADQLLADGSAAAARAARRWGSRLARHRRGRALAVEA